MKGLLGLAVQRHHFNHPDGKLEGVSDPEVILQSSPPPVYSEACSTALRLLP